jgi:hypothetical protein
LNTIYWLLVIAVLITMTFAGWIRPTGLLGRTRAEQEQEISATRSRSGWKKTANRPRARKIQRSFSHLSRSVAGHRPPEMTICHGRALDFRRFDL